MNTCYVKIEIPVHDDFEPRILDRFNTDEDGLDKVFEYAAARAKQYMNDKDRQGMPFRIEISKTKTEFGVHTAEEVIESLETNW